MDVFMCDCCKRVRRIQTKYKVTVPSAELEVCEFCHHTIAECIRTLTKPFPEPPESP